MKLIMTKGLPASGKTTWAKELIVKEPNKWKRISKDDLRAMIDAGQWSRKNEEFIIEIRDTIIEFALLHEFNVIVDDTNLAPKHEARLKQLADFHNNALLPPQPHVDFEVKDFTNATLEECLKRDKARANPVGWQVIMGMYNQFLRPEPKKIQSVPGLPLAAIFDIDGTLALFGDKSPYDRDYSKDELNMPVATLVKMVKNMGWIVILLSGRKDKFKTQTEDWLKLNKINYDFLYMRKTDDDRKDYIVKKEIYDANIKDKYNVEFIVDDRKQIKRMWVENGIFVLDVNQNDIEF